MMARYRQADERSIDAAHRALDSVDSAGLQSARASRLAGLATRNAAGPLGRGLDDEGTTLDLPITAAAAAREHVPHPIDIHVGGRVRLRRQNLAMSQTELAAALCISYQQVQKFERGMNRITAGRLHAMGRALDVPISFFFDALPPGFGVHATGPLDMPPARARDEMEHDTMHSRETLNLVRAYHNVPDAALRARILDLVRSMAPTP